MRSSSYNCPSVNDLIRQSQRAKAERKRLGIPLDEDEVDYTMTAKDSLKSVRQDSIATGAIKPATVEELENKVLDIIEKSGRQGIMQISSGLTSGDISMSEGYVMINAFIKYSRNLSDKEFEQFTDVPFMLRQFINGRS